MERSLGAVKHVLLAKFVDGLHQERIDDFTKAYANLVNLIPLMKSFHWAIDESRKNKNQGYTHIFESTFDSTDDVAEYYDHPDHVAFAKEFLPILDKHLVVDYEPKEVNL